jgi:transposase
VPRCSAQSFHNKVATQIPPALNAALEPLIETIAALTARIQEYDRKLEAVANELYPTTILLRQVQGVGTLSALAFSGSP